MTPIPAALRKTIDKDPYYKVCALYGQHGHVCSGRITMDHSIIFGGSQLQELWAITPVCEVAHGVDSAKDTAAKKELRVWVALNRATVDELQRISKAMDYIRYRTNLNSKWGVYVPKGSIQGELALGPAPKKLWYTPPPEVHVKLDRLMVIEQMVGIPATMQGIINTAIDELYQTAADSLYVSNPEIYEKYGFNNR